MKKVLLSIFAALLALSASAQQGSTAQQNSTSQQNDWVTTWATALQIAEPHNNPPEPYLAGNSFRQIVQVSLGGSQLRLHLSNIFNDDATEILGVEIARAKTMGATPEIDEKTTVRLTFNGSASVTMAPGEAIVSDPVKFNLGNRDNVAITIHYGAISSTRLTSHPGSRTNSYIVKGNSTDFSNPDAVTAHWYTISSIDVIPARPSKAIAVLGDSITDGRGTTTNGQDRWTDQLSRSLLQDSRTDNIAVLNFGLGGNCVLHGGLGPFAMSRYERDLFGHEGVKYVILFEGTNDIGGSRSPLETLGGLKEAWTKIAADAHKRGIKVFVATVTQIKGNGYSRDPQHDIIRKEFNDWIRTNRDFDGVIDFDHVVADPADPDRMDPAFLFENDWLHLNASGYEKMGFSIDRNLFVDAQPLCTNINRSGYPRLLPDGSVEFRVNAPSASRVQIDLCGAKYDLTSAGRGQWAGKSAPQVPGFHYYNLLIDGVSVADPASESYYGCGRMSSAIDIPEEGCEDFEWQDVPHGQVRTMSYWSEFEGAWRPLMVYTPAGYDKGSRKYPVVYIQHGGGEDHRGWMQQGRVAQIMDNLIASGRAVPMIVVSANSNVRPKRTGTVTSGGMGGGGYTWEGMQSFREELLNNVIPFVEKNFRVKSDRHSRAMCGLSMGGGQSFYIGLRSPEVFANVGVFSTGMFGGIAGAANVNLENEVPGIYSDTAAFNAARDVFFLSCGEQDPRITHTRAIVDQMRSKGVKVGFESYPGDHEWQVWRKSFKAFAQQLFK